ncbi:hypothetical protein K458DRAFT_424993 [Lentithecium fluviatile CBS 122367]|uniref:Alpha/beta-hydrolase n=1 Tax=Lentithecium fluviatile CBS 122367 TaxID=1168545 RepID=A0A6G1IE10_9PLEO|nr:hypothetical protein K458DRAFT_424993 [Lentithecium fluviatile CBS 122367]
MEEFRVLGGSGGVPYALACAYALSEGMLKGTGVLAGLGPPESDHKGLSWERWIGFTINRWVPASMLHFIVERGLAKHARNADQTRWRKIIVDVMVKSMTAEDQALITEEEIETMIAGIRGAYLSGSEGYVLDAKNVLGAWPFRLEDIKGEVRLWCGTQDTDTPVGMARWMAERLQGGGLIEFPGDTHFSVFSRRREEVLRKLVGM